MSSSGGNNTSDWQPPSWTSSTSESSLFGNPADDGWGSEDTELPANTGATPSTPAPTSTPAPGPSTLPASYSGSAEPSPPLTSTGVDPFAPTGGVQPSYAADYDADAYSYGSGNDSSGRSSAPSADPDDRRGKPFFQSNPGGNSSGSSRSTNSPSGAIGSGVISVVVSIIFSQVGVFHTFIWFFIVFGVINTVRTLISKRGSRRANRICGGIGLALCIVAAIIQLVAPHGGPGAFWLFQLWSDRH